MSWRKWLVRGLVFTVVAGGAGAAFLYSRWTDPAVVRQQVVDKLHQLFPAASVTLDSARLQIFGGIALRELRLVRRDDPEQEELAYVPSAVVFHDKEHLLDGKIAFRKVELRRPRLRVVRERDGRWNLEGLMASGAGDEPLPTIVIGQGTLVFEDRLAPAGTPPVEITDVSLTLINDPVATLLIEGSGTSEALGAVKLRGSYQRDTRAATLSVQAEGLPLCPTLVQRLSAFCPGQGIEPFPLAGRLDLKGTLCYEPAASQPLQYELSCAVRGGKVQHPQLPLPKGLENLEAALRLLDGRLTVERLTASSGAARLELVKGTATLPRPDQDFEATLTVKHLDVCGGLCERLPEAIRALHDHFRPSGPAAVRIEAARRGGRWLRQTFSLFPDGLAVCFQGFKYPAEGITGVIEYDHLQSVTKVDIQGKAGGGPVTLRGTWKGTGGAIEARLELVADRLPLDRRLIEALPPELQAVANDFKPSGRVQGTAVICRVPGSDDYHCTYGIRFSDTHVCWKAFPLALTFSGGVLNIYPDFWEFKDGRATHNGAEITVAARTYPPPGVRGHAGARLVVDVTGRDVPLTDELRKAAQEVPALATTYETLSPTGRFCFAARLDRAPGRADDVEAVLELGGGSVTPSFFRYELGDLAGRVRYHNGRVELTGLTAAHRGSRFSLTDATIDFYPNGGFYADLRDLRGNPVLPDDAFTSALPEALKTACETLQLRDPFAGKARLVVAQGAEPGAPATIFWDGQMWVAGAKLAVGVDLDGVSGTVACRGLYDGRQLRGLSGNVLLSEATLFKQPFKDVHANLLVRKNEPESLIVGLKAPLFGGDVSGQARVEFGPKLRYELNLTGSQIDLEQFGRHNLGARSQLSGIAAARLHLTGTGAGAGSLQGNGSIDVPYTALTKLYNLPWLLDLLKFLGLRWPDRTLFEEAHAAFNIQGERVHVTRLDLLGNVVTLWGRGEVNLDGSDIQLDFYPGWARIEQVLPAAVRAVPTAISKSLLKIEVRGQLSDNPKDLKFTKKPLPGIVDPLLQVRDFVIGKKN
jgi:hypothetical protein